MSIKSKIWEKLDKDGYITDSDLARIYKPKEPNWGTTSEYHNQWIRLRSDRQFFSDKEITRIEKYRGHKALVNGGWYRICKDYYEEIKPQFIKDNSRPDLSIEMYYKKPIKTTVNTTT